MENHGSAYDIYNEDEDIKTYFVSGNTWSNLRESGLGIFTLLCKIRFMLLTMANSAAFTSFEGRDIFENLKDHLFDVSSDDLFIAAASLLATAANAIFYFTEERQTIPLAAGLFTENFSAVVVTSMVTSTSSFNAILLFSVVYTTLIYTTIVGHYRVRKSPVKCIFYFSPGILALMVRRISVTWE